MHVNAEIPIYKNHVSAYKIILTYVYRHLSARTLHRLNISEIYEVSMTFLL